MTKKRQPTDNSLMMVAVVAIVAIFVLVTSVDGGLSLINEVKNIICERRYMVSAQYDSTGGNYYNLYVVVDAANEKAAIEKGETKIEKLSSSSLASKIGIDDPSGDDTEIAEVDTKKPLSWTDIKKDTSP